jgi:hypothetical protein
LSIGGVSLTESNHLRRKRPKTHWVWYIGSITASLGIGLCIAYAIQQTETAAKIKANNPTTLAIKDAGKSNKSPITIQYTSTTEKSTIPTATQIPVAEKKAPVYQSLQTTTSHSTDSANEKSHSVSVQKKTEHTKKSKAVPATPKNHSKSGRKQNPPKTNPPTTPEPETSNPETSEPNPPAKQHRGPIVKIVNRVTNTVQYLLTGSTNQN